MRPVLWSPCVPQQVGKSAHIEVVRRGNYVRVVQGGRLDSLDAALEVQKIVETAAKGVERGLFDNRETDAPAAQVAQAMWRWLQRRFSKAALLLDEVGERVNRRAAANHSRVRAFTDEEKALHWLTTSDSWPEVELLVFESGGTAWCLEVGNIVEIVPCTSLMSVPNLPASVVGVIEHRKRVLSVASLDDGRNLDDVPLGARVIVTQTSNGLVGILADKTVVLGRIAVEEQPAHGRELDSSVGTVVCVDPEKLAITS
jgi:chemotaxis signal transduction protein